MATLVATQYNPTIRAFDQRLRAAGKAAKVALTACMRKLLTICNAMIKTATPWNLAGPSPTTGPNRQLLRSFRWGQVRQLDRVSRELLASAVGKTRRNVSADLICTCAAPAASVLLIPAVVRSRVIM